MPCEKGFGDIESQLSDLVGQAAETLATEKVAMRPSTAKNNCLIDFARAITVSIYGESGLFVGGWTMEVTLARGDEGGV